MRSILPETGASSSCRQASVPTSRASGSGEPGDGQRERLLSPSPGQFHGATTSPTRSGASPVSTGEARPRRTTSSRVRPRAALREHAIAAVTRCPRRSRSGDGAVVDLGPSAR
jgi:hypothetical protein